MVPERIFSVAFHPGEKLVVAAGDKWGKVKLDFEDFFERCKISGWNLGLSGHRGCEARGPPLPISLSPS